MSAIPTQSNKTPIKEPSIRMKELVQMSHNISVDSNISISKYFISGRELIKSATTFEQKGDLERAFVLYLRYMTLFLEKIIHHPEYSKVDRKEKTLVKVECENLFEAAEVLKKKILVKYNEEYELYQRDCGTSEDSVQKRTLNPISHPPPLNCDMDEIDKKFNFSQQFEDSQRDKVFDPFNIEELKQSFNQSSD